MNADLKIRTAALGLLAALTAAASAAVPLARGASAAAATETCQGQPVTLVVDTGYGEATEGPDVILVEGSGAGSPTVLALGGDDLVCIRDGLLDATVHGGEGDDSVTVETTDGALVRSVGVLGPGDDRYVGGPQPDLVTDFDPDGGEDGFGDYYPDSGDDIVTTLGGDDVALAGGRTGLAQLDGIDLGEGNDVLQLGPSGTTAASRLRGGAGNSDRVLLFSIPEQRMVMDIAQRRAAVLRSRVIARGWTEFEKHDVRTNTRAGAYDPEPPPASITVRGTADRDQVLLRTSADNEAPTVLDVELLGGHDDLSVDAGVRGRANGGDGRDRIGALAYFPLPFRLDLAAGRLTLSGSRGGLTVARFQDARAISARTRWATLVGDADHNRLTGCAVMNGGHGNDTIGPVATPDVRCSTGIRASGGPGLDRLIGSPLDDVLDGGTAYDTANGSVGTDTCLAEWRRNCER